MKTPPNPTKLHDLGIRLLINGSSAFLVGLFIFLAGFDSLRWLFTLAAALLAAVALWEYNQILKKKEIVPASLLSITAVVLFIFGLYFKIQYGSTVAFFNFVPVLILGLSLLVLFIYFPAKQLPPITHVSTGFLGIVYIGVPMGALVAILHFFKTQAHQVDFHGSWWVIYTILVTKSADIGGYFLGRNFGKRKLAAKISPKKTWEGAFGGLLSSLVASLLICFLGRKFGRVFHDFSYSLAAGLGLLIGVLAQLGDLAESAFKRDAGVKDSNAIPAVGGILDMLDSILFTTPVVYLFLCILYHMPL